MNDNELVEPSKEEKDAVAHRALAAARACFGAHDDYKDDRNMVDDLLNAFVAVRNVCRQADRDFEAQHAGKRCYSFGLEESHIVATAAALLDCPHVEASPYSNAGQVLIDFARVIAALEAFSGALEKLDDAGGLFGVYAAGDMLRTVAMLNQPAQVAASHNH